MSITSTVAVYHTPSDICGIHGMAKEHIHATPKWGKFKVPCYDTAFSVTDPNIPGMGGLDISRVKLIFSFKHGDRTYPCTLVHWFLKIDDELDVNTGMWLVQPDFDADGDPLYVVIHLVIIICTAHLIRETDGPLPAAITHVTALDMFLSFYVNKYIDHHAYEITFQLSIFLCLPHHKHLISWNSIT